MADSSQAPDSQDVERLAKAQQQAVRQAQRELNKVFETVYNMYDDPADIRDALMDLIPAIADKYGNVGSQAAAEWYDRMRAKWFSDDWQAVDDTVYTPDEKAMRATIRRLAGHLWSDEENGVEADPDVMLRGLRANMDKWVKAGGRATIQRAVSKDPRRPRFARVPQGPTCGFCLMLASRGFVYSSAEAAGGDMNDYHNDCDCEPVPSWDKKNPKIEGYDPDKFYKQYQACRSTVEDLLTEDRYQKTYVDTFVPKYDDDKPKSFDQWVARQIAAEMDWRDRQWLYDGIEPTIEFVNEEVKKDTEDNRPQEIRTAERMRKHGVKPYFKVDFKEVENPGTHVIERVGLADWAGGIEIKTPDRARSFRSIDGYLGSAGKKPDAIRLIIDNTENPNMTDDQLKEFILQSHRFHRGTVYILTKEQEFIRIK
ncbi:hypothetical protein [Bifidobacterium tissieri]|uniref:VG15 protein n=1 Tax=Bifidobacterium tissieri TaxID=1630162 RepID=UPI00123B44DD|nr:hypothetical protein [Bifidobacterium tissieri]KAA8832602.1 hypothetical protein EM849_03600 [Bifidobacterium tissieri]